MSVFENHNLWDNLLFVLGDNELKIYRISSELDKLKVHTHSQFVEANFSTKELNDLQFQYINTYGY